MAIPPRLGWPAPTRGSYARPGGVGVDTMPQATPPEGTPRALAAFSRDMKPQATPLGVEERKHRLLAGLADLVPRVQCTALALDRSGDFPRDDLNFLRGIGALGAPLPTSLGGLGMGTEPEGARDLMDALRLIGRGSLSVGRLYEAHVNALRLVIRHGTESQARNVAGDALEGHLFGLWVTDTPDAPLRLTEDFSLHGAKAPCSGAGHATRALVTALLHSAESRMVIIPLTPGERADLSNWDTHGMRATASGRMELDGIRVDTGSVVGEPGDYLRQPDFSAGAWRTSAVTLGGLEALVAEMRRQLVARKRERDPHQLARVGEALIAQETARLWILRAAQLGEAADADPQDIANTVNLARIAVEAACLDTIRIVQRALGMTAFRRGGLAELLFRDLGMYLRQPAPDETLIEAASHFMQRDLPALPR
jgi:alkylation response protein AidB-like acyl-CoA dehydrogenase